MTIIAVLTAAAKNEFETFYSCSLGMTIFYD